MSNQVCANNQNKYLPSYNNFLATKIGISQTVGTGVTVNIIYNNVVVNHDDKNISLNQETGEITFLKQGIYSVSCSAYLTDNVDPTKNDINYGLRLYCPEQNLQFGGRTTRIPSIGADTIGSEVFVDTTQCCIFFGKNNRIVCRITNFSATLLKIGADLVTQVIITKVA